MGASSPGILIKTLGRPNRPDTSLFDDLSSNEDRGRSSWSPSGLWPVRGPSAAVGFTSIPGSARELGRDDAPMLGVVDVVAIAGQRELRAAAIPCTHSWLRWVSPLCR